MNFSNINFPFGTAPPSLIIRASNGGEIWQSSAPQGDLHAAGVDVLVLAAEEFQPKGVPPGYYVASETGPFPGVDVVLAPNQDIAFFPRHRQQIALEASGMVSYAVKQGKKVLVTCAAGLNRSGLITALALMRLFGKSGVKAVARVRKQRPGSLGNGVFAQFVIDRGQA